MKFTDSYQLNINPSEIRRWVQLQQDLVATTTDEKTPLQVALHVTGGGWGHLRWVTVKPRLPGHGVQQTSAWQLRLWEDFYSGATFKYLALGRQACAILFEAAPSLHANRAPERDLG